MSEAAFVDITTIEDHEVVRLHEPVSSSIVHVVPSRGSNITRFATAVDEKSVEIIAGPPTLSTLEELPTRWGAGVLFPYPGRVSSDGFNFRGRRIDLQPDPQYDHAMHGVVRRRPWRVINSGAQDDLGAWVTTQITSHEADITPQEWPFPFAFTLRIRLHEGRLRSEIHIENLGEEPMPFGLGFHPYFHTPLGSMGTAESCEIAIEATERWDQASISSPAKVSSIGEDDWPRRALALSDLPATTQSSEGMARNHKFVRRAPPDGDIGLRATLTDNTNGIAAVLEASGEMRTLVFYTPPTAPVISFEPHTCIPNGFNIKAAGIPDPGVLVLEPGQIWEAWYQIRTELLH